MKILLSTILLTFLSFSASATSYNCEVDIDAGNDELKTVLEGTVKLNGPSLDQGDYSLVASEKYGLLNIMVSNSEGPLFVGMTDKGSKKLLVGIVGVGKLQCEIQ